MRTITGTHQCFQTFPAIINYTYMSVVPLLKSVFVLSLQKSQIAMYKCNRRKNMIL